MIVSEINIKLGILGLWSSGKTSMVNSFLSQDVPGIYIPTIGSNIVRKEYQLESFQIRLNIWDVGGQKSFNPLNPAYFSNLDIVFLVFDLSNPKETLLELKKTYLKSLERSSPNSIRFLVGNKSDLIKPEDSEILLNAIRQYGIEEIPIIFVSAKTQDNLSDAFELIVFEFLKKLEKESKKRQIQGLSKEFLRVLGKNESDFDKLLVNLEEIDSNNLQQKITPQIVKKVIKMRKKPSKVTKIEEIASATYSEDFFIIDKIKSNVIKLFHNNLSSIQGLISSLKTTPIDYLINRINLINEELYGIKEDFEAKLNSLFTIKKNGLKSFKKGE
ncbi:MAG: GTP-binding protein [Promethearchaeota archaeon]|nr:MAG: GTP-binding protein [Candidatus Lokiarchaeota archaeon]